MRNPIQVIREWIRPKGVLDRANDILRERGYREVIALGGQNSDWQIESLGQDAKIWQNIFMLRARMRDLFDTNPYFAKYRELLWANVFGDRGIMLRMKIKEEEDRVIHSPDEKAAIREHERMKNRLRKWAAAKRGEDHEPYVLLRELGTNGSRKATVQVGEPDVFAIRLVEGAWAEWQRAEFCDVRGLRDYGVLRQLRLLSAARDGGFFIRMIRSPRINKFGFSLQCINDEWCDYFYNDKLRNGNVVRMGIEYTNNEWGIGKPVAYYFIKRQAGDWQYTAPGTFSSPGLHERVPAEEIIHYARYTDADSTRPAPWGANTIVKARNLDQFELAEVIAARAAACKTGWLTSDVVPEGGFMGNAPDPSKINTNNIKVEPGGLYGLPWGINITESDPTHPNGNFESFRKGMLRSWCAGMPGADYNVIANDLENINFSAGRLGRLDTNETSKILQVFDINIAERRIFEAWLECALMNQAIKLPLLKYDKFNKPIFTGRRWAQVDETKAVNAAALRIANKLSSRQAECAEEGIDFEDNLEDLAYEEMLLEEYGMKTETTVETPPVLAPGEDDTEGASTKPTTAGTKKPAPKKKGANPRLTIT